jgi:hypothetical protein
MRLSILTAILFLTLGALPALAQEAEPAPQPPPETLSSTPPAAPAEAYTNQRPMNFYNGGIRMGTSYCRNANFDCNSIGLQQSEIVTAANQCIRERFQIEKEIMGSWSDVGEFENCVLPVEPSTNDRGLQEWAVCCVKKGDGDMCNLYCTRFINQKQ